MTSFALCHWSADLDGVNPGYSSVRPRQWPEGESFVQFLVCRECGRQTVSSVALRLCGSCERRQERRTVQR